ncbi:MAG: C10 family peptidase [Bacteroidales bacterium]
MLFSCVVGQVADELQSNEERALSFIRERSDEMKVTPPEHLETSRIWMRQDQKVLQLSSFRGREGFVIYTAEGYSFQMVAYALTGGADPSDLPPAMEWYVGFIADQISSGSADLRMESMIPAIKSAGVMSGVTPLLSSKWDQRCFYNDSCPADSVAPAYYCGRAPAGCVATTLAQILKYHKWPLQGTGTKSYYSIKYGTLSANFGSTVYGIAAMPDEIFAAHPGVAQLLWHAGVASQMNYGPFASGTAISDARSALVNHFGYKSSTLVVAKSAYTDPDWKALMRGEIDLGRPVFYSGIDQASNSGHAWVLDGYSGNDYFHFNWGWSGIADGYFLLASLNPLGSANYNAFQEAIIHIEPQGNFPLASFSADNTMITHGGSVTFSDLSLGSIISWQWEFPGGAPAAYAGKNPPPVAYGKSGRYDVKLVVSNGVQTDTIIKKGYIEVLPLAFFISDTRFTETGGSVGFYDNSASQTPLQNYAWRFFGGTPGTSSQKNPPAVIYSQPGQYAVLLTVNDGQNIDKHLALKYLTVYNQCDTLLDFYMPGWTVQPVNQAAFQVYEEDLDALIPYHNQYISSGWDYFSEGGGANHFVSATSLFQSPGTADNWLIFGPVTLPAAGATLQWKHKFPDHTKRDGYEILISATGHTHQHFGDPPVFAIGDNDAFSLGDTTWTLCSVRIDPAAYGNQSIWVAVHHYANNMFYIGLDDFRLISCDGFPLNADFFSFDTIISAGDSALFFDFSSGDPDQLVWSFPGGTQVNTIANAPLVRYDQPGVYDVTLTAWYGSTSDLVVKNGYVEVKPVGVNESGTAHQEIKIFPNPATSKIFIVGCPENGTYSLSDISGKVAQQGMVSKDQQIMISDLPGGIWILEIIADGKSFRFRVIKK